MCCVCNHPEPTLVIGFMVIFVCLRPSDPLKPDYSGCSLFVWLSANPLTPSPLMWAS